MRLNISRDTEARLVALAQAHGVSLEKFLHHVVEEKAAATNLATTTAALSPAERAAAWRESVKGLPHTPALCDEAISRENMYGSRG